MKKNKIKLGLLTSGILVAINVVIIALSSADSAMYLQIEREAHELNSQNRELSESLVTETALVSILKKSENLNMTKPNDIVYLSQEALIARLP